MHKLKQKIALTVLMAVISTPYSGPILASTATKDNITTLRSEIHLGDVKLNIKAKNELATQHFELGMSFLHAFMYQLAIDQFKQAQELDPGFMMAYWGEAMANKHPIWNFEDVKQARAALARYEKHKDNRTLSDKEMRYLQAVKKYFAKKHLRTRDNDYVEDMRAFYQGYPNDVNVGAFYSLALLGRASDFASSPSSAKDVKTGRELISNLYKRYPNHPGIVHYFIHYHDVTDKNIAKKALPAAKTALTLMRSSSHVAHMAAHIYRRLELWPEFIDANKQSVKAADDLCYLINGKRDYKCNADNKYHSLEWLQYGYLKTGQHEKAHNAYKLMENIYNQDKSLPYKQWYYRMWARHVIGTQKWRTRPIEIDAISKKDANLYWNAYTECSALLAKGMLKAHQLQPVKPTLKRLDTVISLTKQLSEPYIQQTCRLAKLEVEKTQATVASKPKLAAEKQKQIDALLKKRISTELTPSLSIMPGTF